MERYQGLQDNLQNLTKSLGSGDRVAASAEMKKLLAAQKTPQGRQLIDQVAQKEPRLPYMIAGASVNPHLAVGASGIVEKGSLPFHAYNIGSALVHGVSTGDMHPLLGASAAALAQGTVQSPHFIAGANYTAGQTARAFKPQAQAVAGAHQPVREILNAADQGYQQPLPQRAAGGAVGGHQHLVDRLLSAVERAKREEKEHTKPILHMPDEAVASALNKAQEAI
jgi:hypothetical protein